MPFDGICVRPGSPLAILLAVDSVLTAERRAAARLRRKPLTLKEAQAQRIAQARASVIVLGKLEELLGDDGQNWITNAYANGFGSYCLVGGLRHIRAVRGCGDHAGVYLRRAIARVSRGEAIIHFNDSRTSFAEIRLVIFLARQLAREVADGRA